MGFQALVVPEDPTYNGYILEPLVRRMLAECGKPKARVTVVSNPRLNGYEHAKAMLKSSLMDQYAHFDLFLFLPDKDGKDRGAEFGGLESFAAEKGVKLLCCAAEQEVETWLLAGHVDKLSRPWVEVRSDVSVKENVFAGFLARHGDPRRPGGGREELMRETLEHYDGLLRRCPELWELQRRIREIMG